MKRHARAVVVLAVAGALGIAWAVYVFWWFTGVAQSSGLVPSSLGSWTMGNLVAFILNAIFWELVLVGVPAAIGAFVAWRWWKSLPGEERMGYRLKKRARRTGTSGGFGFFLFVLFAIKVWLDGSWNVPLASFTLTYVVGSMIEILGLLAVVLGIPAIIFLAWWIRREMNLRQASTT